MITSSDVTVPTRDPRRTSVPENAPRQTTLSLPKLTNPDQDIEAFHEIFKAKCKDLEIAVPSSIQRKRFIDIARANCAAPYFGMSSQALGAESAKKIVQYLAGAGNNFFHTLDISCNKLADYGTAALAWLLERDQSLTRLNCASNCIGADGGELLLHALTNNVHLTSIDLSTVPGVNRNKVGPRGASALAATLLANQVLASVNLSQNCIGPAGAASLAAAMPFNVSLTELSIASNSLGIEGATVLAEGLPRSALESLNLDRNGLCCEGLTILSEAFPDCERLHTLSLADNKIGSRGVTALAKTLEHNRTPLRTLILHSNNLKAAGADALASALRGCCELESLDLQQCALRNGSAEALLFACGQSNTLHTLNLSRNELGNKDGAAAAATIRADKIKFLDLSSNCIGDAGGTHIAEELAHNTSLHKLSLRGNYMHEAAGNCLAQALQLNCSLLKLDVEGNQFPHTVFKDIGVSLHGNKQGHAATEVDRLWDDLDRMRVKELELFETEGKIEEHQEAAENAEEELTYTKEKLDSSQEELRIAQQTLKKLLEDANAEKEELNHQLNSVVEDISRWTRQTNEKNSGLDSKIAREIDQRKRIEKEILKLTKDLGQASVDADKVGIEQEENLERAQRDLEKAERDANFQDQRMETFISSLPPSLHLKLAQQQLAQQEMNDDNVPDQHRWETEVGVNSEDATAPSRHSRYSTPSAHSSRPTTAHRKTEKG